MRDYPNRKQPPLYEAKCRTHAAVATSNRQVRRRNVSSQWSDWYKISTTAWRPWAAPNVVQIARKLTANSVKGSKSTQNTIFVPFSFNYFHLTTLSYFRSTGTRDPVSTRCASDEIAPAWTEALGSHDDTSPTLVPFPAVNRIRQKRAFPPTQSIGNVSIIGSIIGRFADLAELLPKPRLYHFPVFRAMPIEIIEKKRELSTWSHREAGNRLILLGHRPHSRAQL